MSFQNYLNNIQAKTGKSPDAFMVLAQEKGYRDADGLRPGIKAGEVLDWLKQDFDLGRGHGMALVALFKGKRE